MFEKFAFISCLILSLIGIAATMYLFLHSYFLGALIVGMTSCIGVGFSSSTLLDIEYEERRERRAKIAKENHDKIYDLVMKSTPSPELGESPFSSISDPHSDVVQRIIHKHDHGMIENEERENGSSPSKKDL